MAGLKNIWFKVYHNNFTWIARNAYWKRSDRKVYALWKASISFRRKLGGYSRRHIYASPSLLYVHSGYDYGLVWNRYYGGCLISPHWRVCATGSAWTLSRRDFSRGSAEYTRWSYQCKLDASRRWPRGSRSRWDMEICTRSIVTRARHLFTLHDLLHQVRLAEVLRDPKARLYSKKSHPADLQYKQRRLHRWIDTWRDQKTFFCRY